MKTILVYDEDYEFFKKLKFRLKEATGASKVNYCDIHHLLTKFDIDELATMYFESRWDRLKKSDKKSTTQEYVG